MASVEGSEVIDAGLDGTEGGRAPGGLASYWEAVDVGYVTLFSVSKLVNII